MIIKRIAEGIKNQDWFVVGVEIMIVVVGIFAGLQVTDWNEARKEQIEEKQYLNRLHGDMATQIEQMTIRETYFKVAAADNQTVINWLNDPTITKLSPQRLLSAFYNSTVIYPFKPYSVTHEELISTGNVRILRDVDLRNLIAQYFYETEPLLSAWNIDDNNPYRELVRSTIPVHIQNLIATTCEPSIGNDLALIQDCAANIDDKTALAILQLLHQQSDIKPKAIRNYSRLIVALRLYKANIETAGIVKNRLREGQ